MVTSLGSLASSSYVFLGFASSLTGEIANVQPVKPFTLPTSDRMTRISQIVSMADISAMLKALCDSKHIERERAKGQLEILLKQTSKTKMDV